MVFQLIRILNEMIMVQVGPVRRMLPNGNLVTIISMVGFLLAGSVIGIKALELIRCTEREMALSHLKPIPLKDYVWLLVATVGLCLGVTSFLSMIGMMEQNSDYQAVANTQFAANIYLTAIGYGFVSPVAEELLFRGLIYTRMRQYFHVRIAIVASAALFGLYHGNSVQVTYAFVMGLFMAYAYEAFGSFYMPLGIHIGANILACMIQYRQGLWSWLFTWPACIILMVTVAAAIVVLLKKHAP